MCDYYFYQRMENTDGDLADIFRNSSLAGRPESSANLQPGRESSWQLLPDQQAASFPPPSDTFGDPFPNTRDPLLHELAAASFFDSPETVAVMASGGGGDQKMLFGDEGKRPSSNLFSRMPQISPGTSYVSPVIGPPSLMATGSGAAVDHGGSMQISLPRMSGIKRRKGQAKKVVCIPAPAAASGRPSGEAVPSDLWAWRKYGQKPIKGSPYPRGYYRCSSSKGCSARKQVERSRTDPNMLVITYTSEHNHPWPTQRNALAGSTRSQPPKANNSSSSKKCSPQNEKQLITNIKAEEPKECSSSSTPVVKEEAQEMEKTWFDHQLDGHDFDRVFDESFNKHMISNPNQPDDFFADLAELEQDPMNLIFPKGFMGDHKLDDERDKNNNKAMNPFNLFDNWGGGSTFGDAKRGL